MRSVSIASDGYNIFNAKDEQMEWLTLNTNKKVYFFPVDIASKFPNLIMITAHACSIEAISRKNFRNLNKLIHLEFYSNKIERIESDTFKDLVALEYLWISKKFNLVKN